MSAPQGPDRHSDPCAERPPALEACGGDADGVELRTQAKQRERRYFLTITACAGMVALFATVLGVLVGVGGVDGLADLAPVEWAVVVGLPVGVLLLVLLVTGALMMWRRRRGLALFAPTPLWELPTQRERRDLLRALRRGHLVAPAQHDLARRVAQDMTRRRGLIWLYVVVGALQGVNALIGGDGWIRWVNLASAVIAFGLAGYFFWLIRRMDQARRRLEYPDRGSRVSEDFAAGRGSEGADSEGRDGR